MSKRKFAEVDSEEMILNKCPLCNGCKCYNKNARKFRNSNVGISAFLL